MTGTVDLLLTRTRLHGVLVRARARVRARKLLDTDGYYLEFVGPSGVGKTTLLDGIKNRVLGDWRYWENIAQLESEIRDDAIDGAMQWQLLYAKARTLEGWRLNGFRKTLLMRYSSWVALSDIKIFNSQSTGGFWLHEGLCQNFSEEINALPDEEFSRVMFGRALVFVMPRRSMTVVERIKRRDKEADDIVPHHIGLDEDGLMRVVEAEIANCEGLARRAEAAGIPICRVFAEDDPAMQADSVLAFERRILTAGAKPAGMEEGR